MAVMTKKGAREVTQTLDRIANLFQSEAELLGVPTKIATDFALRCDLLADHIERTASANEAALAKRADYYKGKNETGLSVEPPPSDGVDANNIGDEVPGPLEMIDSHEPWMKGEFTQEELNALRILQQSGKLGPNIAVGLHTKSAAKKAEDKAEEKPAFPFQKKEEEGEKGEEKAEKKASLSHGFNLTSK